MLVPLQLLLQMVAPVQELHILLNVLMLSLLLLLLLIMLMLFLLLVVVVVVVMPGVPWGVLGSCWGALGDGQHEHHHKLHHVHDVAVATTK